MKKIFLIAASIAFASAALAQSDPAPKAEALKPAVSDYNRGWCNGWAVAASLTGENFRQWQKFISVLSPKIKDDKSATGDAVRSIFDSVPKAILINPQPGKVTLADGTVIDCEAK